MHLANIRRGARGIAVRSGLIGLAAFGLLAGVAGAAADDLGLVDDFAYESPTYGYEITWDRPWEADEEGTAASGGVDILTLESFGGFFQVIGVETDWTTEEMIELHLDGIPEEVFDDYEILDEGEEDGLAYTLLEGETDGTAMVYYVEAWEVEEAPPGGAPIVASTILLSSEETFANNAKDAAADILVGGEAVLTMLDLDESEDRDADEDERGSREDEDEDDDFV